MVWVLRVYFNKLFCTPGLTKAVTSVITRMDSLGRTRGPVFMCSYVKDVRLHITRFFSGEPLLTRDVCSIFGNGLPKMIPNQIREKIYQRDTEYFKLIITVLSLTRSILGGKPVDLTPITDPYQGKHDMIAKYIPMFIRAWGIQSIKSEWSQYHFTLKSGPNGPGLLTANVDRNLLPETLVNSIKLVAGEDLSKLLDMQDILKDSLIKLVEDSDLFGPKSSRTKKFIRKLSVRPDRESKSRVFAIMDYYSQTALKPLHDDLFSILKNSGLSKVDKTFLQGDDFNLKVAKGTAFHSLDLSNATDRFPIALQEELLGTLWSDAKRSKAWRDIMTGYEFSYQGCSYSYGAGQPMGAYSSWPMFTLTHHLTVFVAGKLAGYRKFSNYRILGDDIVIADNQVAKYYRELMDSMKVSISESKTHVSFDTCEFAKRWFHKGREISPFPIHGLLEINSKVHLLIELLRSAGKRGYDNIVEPGRPLYRVRHLIQIFLGEKSRLARGLYTKFCIIASIPQPKSSNQDILEGYDLFFKTTGESFGCSASPQTIIDNFDEVGRYALANMLKTQSEKIVIAFQSWLTKINATFKDLELGKLEQSMLTSKDKPLLVIPSVIQAKLESSLDSINMVTDYMEGDSIWDMRPALDLIPTPDFKGINPIRKSYQILGARSLWSQEVINRFVKRRKSLATPPVTKKRMTWADKVAAKAKLKESSPT